MRPDQKILFLCSMNRLRSPTAERVFRGVPGLEVRSAGLDLAQAQCPCEAEDLQWADLVLVMEARHRKQLNAKFGADMRGRKAIVLGIPDQYAFMQPELVDLLLAKVPQFLAVQVDRQAVRGLLSLPEPALPPVSFSTFW